MIPLRGIWRDERFADDVEQAKLQALSDADRREHRLRRRRPPACSRSPSVPRASPAAELDAGQRDLLRALLATYLDRVPTVSPSAGLDDARSTPCTSPGRAHRPGAPHYYRLQGPRLLIE